MQENRNMDFKELESWYNGYLTAADRFTIHVQ